MENEILLYPNKKGLEGVIALTRTRPLISQALNRRAGQEGVGERSNFKKIPTHTQDHGDA